MGVTLVARWVKFAKERTSTPCRAAANVFRFATRRPKRNAAAALAGHVSNLGFDLILHIYGGRTQGRERKAGLVRVKAYADGGSLYCTLLITKAQ